MIGIGAAIIYLRPPSKMGISWFFVGFFGQRACLNLALSLRLVVYFTRGSQPLWQIFHEISP